MSIEYDQDSFLAGLAFARNVVGWVGGRGESWINESTITTFNGVLIGANGYVTAKPLRDIVDISYDDPVTSRAVASALASKQNALTFDQTPQAGSSNPVYSNGIAVQLNLKAPLDSPSFSGMPHAPTPTAGASNTQIATTEFVMKAIASGGGGGGTSVVANPTAAATDTLNKLQVGQTVYSIAGGSGTGTIISKTISSNGVYNAATESADGYNPIMVNVPQAEIYYGITEPSSSLGEDGDIYYRKYLVEPTSGLNKIVVNITKALRGSNVLTYAGAHQIHVIFDDGNSNEVSMQLLNDFSYSVTATPNRGTVSYAFDNNLNTYWEANNTPITLTINATIPSGYIPKRLEVYQRTGSYNTDIWSTFTVNYIDSNRTFSILSKEDLTTSDWAGAGNWTLFNFNESIAIVEEVYIKINGEWTITDKIEFDDPLLISKTINSNGIYLASNDNVDGYNQVIVDVAGGSGGVDYLTVVDGKICVIYEVT